MFEHAIYRALEDTIIPRYLDLAVTAKSLNILAIIALVLILVSIVAVFVKIAVNSDIK